jgi:hypothetical protein
MASEFFAVDGMSIDFVSGSDSGDLTITGNPSTKVKINSNGVYKTTTAVTVSNFENDSVNNGSGSGVFIATTIKNKAEGLFILRNGDLAILSGTGTNKNPPPASLPFTSTIEITDPNNTKVRGE